MEEVTARLLAKIRGTLSKDYDVTTLDGQLFLLFDGTPFVISAEQAESVTIKTRRGTFSYPPKMMPPESEETQAEKRDEPDSGIIRDLKKVPLADIKKAIKVLGIEGPLKHFIPDKPKKIDLVNGLARMFAPEELAEGKKLLYKALKI